MPYLLKSYKNDDPIEIAPRKDKRESDNRRDLIAGWSIQYYIRAPIAEFHGLRLAGCGKVGEWARATESKVKNLFPLHPFPPLLFSNSTTSSPHVLLNSDPPPHIYHILTASFQSRICVWHPQSLPPRTTSRTISGKPTSTE